MQCCFAATVRTASSPSSRTILSIGGRLRAMKLVAERVAAWADDR
jgi:hypothetical protein